MQIDEDNNEKLLLQHNQADKPRPKIAESFLRSSNKKVECDKCKQMIHFQNIDIHQIICRGQTVECLYCTNRVPIRSINLHEIACSVKKKFDQQLKNQSLKPSQIQPKQPPTHNQPSPKLVNKQTDQTKPPNPTQMLHRIKSMTLLKDQREFYVNPQKKQTKYQNPFLKIKQELKVKHKKNQLPQVKPVAQFLVQFKPEAQIQNYINNQLSAQIQLKPEQKVQQKYQKKVEIEKKGQTKVSVGGNLIKKAKVDSTRKIFQASIKPQPKVEQPKQKNKPTVERPQLKKVQPTRKVPIRQALQAPIHQNRELSYQANQNSRPLNPAPVPSVRNNGFIRRNIYMEDIPFIPPEPKAKNPLTQTKIKRLPRVSYRPSEQNCATQCSICYLDFEQDEDLVKFEDCKHLFHHECIAVWLKTDNRCAICRRQVKVPPKLQ